MGRRAQLGRRLLAAFALLVAADLAGFAQEKPLDLTGVFTTGFYTTNTVDGRDFRVTTAPAILTLDLNGYLGNPGFISYQLRPQLSTGEQATEAGFVSGNGLSLSTTFLGRRSFPLTLTYSNLQREQVAYGTLNRISGLRSTSHTRDFGVNWQVRLQDLPNLSFEYGRARETLDPDEPLIPAFDSRSTRYGVTLDDRRWGWNFAGHARWENFTSDFSQSLEPDIVTVALDRDLTQFQFSAQRPLWSQSRLSLNAGLLDSRNTFNDRPFDQEVRYLSSTLNLGWGQRWRGGLRAAYTTNLLGTEIQDVLGQLSGAGGSGVPSAEALLFVPFQSRITSRAFSGNLRYQAHRDWGFFGSVSRNDVSTPDGLVFTSDSSVLNGSGGVSFNRSFSWARLSSQYTLTVGRMTFGSIPDSRITGHSFSLTAQRGALERLEVTGSLNASWQRVNQTVPLRTGNQSADFAVARRVRNFVVRGGLGIQRSSFLDGGVDYNADGLTFRASLEHSRAQFRYSRNTVDGNTLQGLLTQPATSAGASAILLGTPLQIINSSFRTETLSLHATPWRRLEADLSWIQGRQEFDNRVNNDYDQFDLRVGYQFRLLAFAVGYLRYEQSFLALTHYTRDRLYFRVSRPFRVF